MGRSAEEIVAFTKNFDWIGDTIVIFYRKIRQILSNVMDNSVTTTSEAQRAMVEFSATLEQTMKDGAIIRNELKAFKVGSLSNSREMIEETLDRVATDIDDTLSGLKSVFSNIA